MDAISLFAGLVLGAAGGAAIGFLVARGRQAAEAASLSAQVRAAEEKTTLVEQAAREKAELVEGQLAERIRALSTEALDANSRRFLELAEIQMRAFGVRATSDLETRRAAVEHLVAPLKDTLARVETQLRESDAARRESHAELAKQVDVARASSDQLREQTQALVTALRRPEARGRWGELQLRRVVELPGPAPPANSDLPRPLPPPP